MFDAQEIQIPFLFTGKRKHCLVSLFRGQDYYLFNCLIASSVESYIFEIKPWHWILKGNVNLDNYFLKPWFQPQKNSTMLIVHIL